MSLRDTISLAFGDGRCFRPQKTKWGLLIGRGAGRHQAGSTSGIENLLSLRKNFRLRRRWRSYFLVYCSFPISKFPRRRRPFLNFYLPPCWWSQKARVHCSFPISKFPRRRRPFLNFHTALLIIATGAHTQTKSTSGKKFAFASRKFSPSATVLKLFSSTLFFSDFKFIRPSEALALAKIFRFQIFPGLA